MSYPHPRAEETEGPFTQIWGLTGLNQRFSGHDSSFDQQSQFTVEDFDNDVDQSVVSSTGRDNNPAYFVSPPTSTYSHSNAGDICNNTSSQFYTTDGAHRWGCDQLISNYDISDGGQDSLAIDPQLDSSQLAVFMDNDEFTFLFQDDSTPTVAQPSYTDASAFLGDGLLAGNVGPPPAAPHLEPPKITVEDTAGMGSWLKGMYTPGWGNTNNAFTPSPPQPGSSSVPVMTLDATYGQMEPADDQVSESSINTSHTSHSCQTCSRNFGNKDDLRRHQRYHDPKKKHACRCGKSFVHPKDLRRHKETHSVVRSEKRCPVDGCATAIGRLDNLKRHVQNKHPEFDIGAWLASRQGGLTSSNR